MPIAQASAIVVNQSHEEQVSRSRTQSSSSSPDFAATTFLRVKAITMTASTTIPAAVNPAILLCDEPTGNLDSINSEAIIDLLTTLNGAGTTVVIITHNPEIAGIGNLRLRLHDGVVTRDAA